MRFEVQNGCFAYPGGRPLLRNISFGVEAPRILAVLGPNGAGKSTLLRCMLGLLPWQQGQTLLDGRPLATLSKNELWKTVGYVPQRPDLMEELTVNQQLKLWQSACGLTGKLPREPLDLMGVEPMLKSRISTLSGGMKQRVSIAMALLSSPEILIMDEATTGLDREYRERLLSWLEGYLARGGRVLWCSHHARELDRLCGSCLHIGARD